MAGAKQSTRHARTRWEYGSQPGRQGIIVTAIQDDPAVPQHRKSKVKDTVAWCRGKPGIPHRPVIESHAWGGVAPELRRPCHWMWNYAREDVVWSCQCHRLCQDCRKVIDHSVAEADCLSWGEHGTEDAREAAVAAFQAEEPRLRLSPSYRKWQGKINRRKQARLAQMGVSGYRKSR
jgi:hypothetical protein